MVSVIAFIAKKCLGAILANKPLGMRNISVLPGSQYKLYWVTQGIAQSMQFGGEPAATASETWIGAWSTVKFFFFAQQRVGGLESRLNLRLPSQGQYLLLRQ